MAKEKCMRCTWCVSFRKTCNERWTKFRNRFRDRYYRRRGETVDPSTLHNETGTRDMVVAKRPYISNKMFPDNLTSVTSLKECPAFAECMPTTDEDQQVEEYVACIINAAAYALTLERWPLPSNTSSTHVMPADDSISLSSSVISQIASNAVASSLTNIALDSDENQSAKHGTRPRTVKEVLETFAIAEDEVVDGSLPISQE